MLTTIMVVKMHNAREVTDDNNKVNLNASKQSRNRLEASRNKRSIDDDYTGGVSEEREK